MKIIKIDALGQIDRSCRSILEILYHDGIGLNAEFKDVAVMCYLFGLLIMSKKLSYPLGVSKGSASGRYYHRNRMRTVSSPAAAVSGPAACVADTIRVQSQ
jgi:hypothetical protein